MYTIIRAIIRKAIMRRLISANLKIYGVSRFRPHTFGGTRFDFKIHVETEILRAKKTEETAVNNYAAVTRRRHAARTVRAMCEASRGRQLRLIRAETDSGRSDGLLNTLTCRQPSARLHFLHPSPFASFTTRPNFVPVRAITNVTNVVSFIHPRVKKSTN